MSCNINYYVINKSLFNLKKSKIKSKKGTQIRVSFFFRIFTNMNWWEIENKAINEILSNLDRVNTIHIAESTGKMLDYNEAQLDQMKNADNKTITPSYSLNYAKFKGFKNPNLKLSGDFRNAMYIDFKANELQFSSTDWKTGLLTDKYGPDIFGLTKENAEKTFNTDKDAINKKTFNYISNVISKAL